MIWCYYNIVGLGHVDEDVHVREAVHVEQEVEQEREKTTYSKCERGRLGQNVQHAYKWGILDPEHHNCRLHEEVHSCYNCQLEWRE